MEPEITHMALAVEARLPSGSRFPGHWLIVLIFLASLAHGLLYIFLVPPWQHYEEPSYFEYSWMIFTRRSIPGYGAFDNAIRREIAASMVEHGFFRNLGFLPNLDAQDEPIWIGLGQADTAPLLHVLMTAPLGWFSWADVDSRLYAARLVSLMLYLLTVGLSFCLVGELTPPSHPLRWSVLGSMALLPGLADLMTAFNDDVGAVLIFLLFLWATVRMVLHGFSLWRLLGVCVLAALCLWTKTTVLVAIPLLPVAVALAVMNGRTWPMRSGSAVPVRRWKPKVLAPMFLGIVLVIASVFAWGDPLTWYRVSPQPGPTRVVRPETPWGRYAIALTVTPQDAAAQVRQPLLAPDAKALRGKHMTVGAWIWATAPAQGSLPMVLDGRGAVSGTPPIALSTAPTFHALRTVVSEEADQIQLMLIATLPDGRQAPLSVFYDGIVLVEGEWPLERAPEFADLHTGRGLWGGQPFLNRVRNASAETGAPRVRPWAEALFKRYAENYLSPSTLVAAVWDWEGTSWIYLSTSLRLLETFWARFGWAQVGLSPGWYWGMAIASALGLAGAVPRLGRAYRRQNRPWKLAVIWLALATMAIWGAVFVRGLFTVVDERVFIPVARYAYPAIIPTMLLLTAGWQEWLRRLPRVGTAAHLAGFLVLDVASIGTVVSYFSGQ